MNKICKNRVSKFEGITFWHRHSIVYNTGEFTIFFLSMKAIIVDVAPSNLSREELDIRLDEVENLVNTYGSLVVVRKVQKRETPDYATYV